MHAMSIHIWYVAKILSLQEEVDLSEIGPIRFIPLPALTHQVIDLLWAILWYWQIQLKN